MSIVIMGGTGAGKSTVAQVLSDRTGFPVYEVGHVVKHLYRLSLEDELMQLYANNTHVQKQIETLLENHGKDYFTNQRLVYAGAMVRRNGSGYFVRHLLTEHPEEDMIIVGVRTNQEVRVIRSLRQHPFFVALTCETDMLLNRFVERERWFMERHVARNIFDKRYESERERGLLDILIECDLLLKTDRLSPAQLANHILRAYIQFLPRTE